MARRQALVKKDCAFCGPEFARYPHQVATKLRNGKPCCELCDKALSRDGLPLTKT